MTCGVCLKGNAEVINVFGEQGIRLEISAVIREHFWFEPVEEDPILSQICQLCWEQIASFHVFYTSVKEAHQKISETYYANQQFVDNGAGAYYLPVQKAEYKEDTMENAANITERLPEVSILPVLQSKKIRNNFNGFKGNGGLPDGAELICKEEEESILEQGATYNSSNYSGKYFPENYNYLQHSGNEDEADNLISNESTINASENMQEEYSNFYNSNNEWQRLESSNVNTIQNAKDFLLGEEEHYNENNCFEKSFLNSGKNFKSKAYRRDESQSRTTEEDALISKYIKLDCEVCSTTFDKFCELSKHYQIVHNISGYARCCDRKLPSRSYILDHINKHINPGSYECKKCNKTFASQYAIKNHMVMKHAPEEEKIYECKDCPKRFTNQYSLSQHEINHLPEDEKRLYCTDCRKLFPTPTAIQMHRNVYHKKIIGHICHVCGKVIRGKSLFVKHVNDHARHLGPVAINDPVCPICGKLSASIKTLRHHIRYVHSSDRPHKCSVCGKGFKIRQKLKEHMGTHAIGLSLPCPYCPKRFKSKIHVYSHKYRMHKTEYEKEKLNRFQNLNVPYESYDLSTSNLYENETQQNYDDGNLLSENSSPDDCYVVV